MSGQAFRYLTQPTRTDFNVNRTRVAGHHGGSLGNGNSRRRSECHEALHTRELGRCWCGTRLDGLARDMAVMTVALDRFPASFANGVFERGNSLLLGRGGASHVENLFLQDCSMEIVHTVAQ